jgi:hypothetical protein
VNQSTSDPTTKPDAFDGVNDDVWKAVQPLIATNTGVQTTLANAAAAFKAISIAVQGGDPYTGPPEECPSGTTQNSVKYGGLLGPGPQQQQQNL